MLKEFQGVVVVELVFFVVLFGVFENQENVLQKLLLVFVETVSVPPLDPLQIHGLFNDVLIARGLFRIDFLFESPGIFMAQHSLQELGTSLVETPLLGLGAEALHLLRIEIDLQKPRNFFERNQGVEAIGFLQRLPFLRRYLVGLLLLQSVSNHLPDHFLLLP